MSALLRLVLLAGLCLAAGLSVLALTGQSRDRLAQAVSELERLRAAEAQLQGQIAALAPATEASMAPLPPEALWPMPQLSDVERQMQDHVLTAAETAGMTVISFGGLGADPRCVLPCLAYEAEMSGSHEAVVGFLSAIEAVRPLLSTRMVWMRQMPADTLGTGAPVNLRVTLWGLTPNLTEGGAP